MNEVKTYIRSNRALVLCSLTVIAAFTMRLFIANAQVIAQDGLLYIKIARNISSGNLQSITEYGIFNLYSFLIALFQKVFQDWELSGKMVSVILGSLTAIPLFFLIKGLFSVRIAFISALCYSVHPRFVEYSSDVLREPTCWFFSIMGLWLAREGISRQRYSLFALSSLSVGLAMVTRMEGVVFFFVIILWILWELFSDRTVRRKTLIYLCIFLISLPILMAPLLLVVKYRIHRWELGHPIEKISQLVMADEGIEADVLKTASPRMKVFQEISERHRYVMFIMEVLYKFVKSFNIVLFALFLLGLYKRVSTPHSKADIISALWFLAAFCGLFFYVMRIHYLGTRHGLLMVFPALAWAGVGFFEIRERIRKWFGGMELFQRYARLDTLFLIILILIVLIPQTVFSYRYDKVELKKAGIVLKNMGFSNATFIVQPTLNRVAFYADAESVPLPDKIDNNVMKELVTKHRAQLLIIDERTIDEYIPGIRKIIGQPMFEKLIIPAMDQYREYSFSIYRIQHRISE
jgi:4-amino-4-deoxy-L-arabinose transferase-like glycosyltransferase